MGYKIIRNPECHKCGGFTCSTWARYQKNFNRIMGIFYCPKCDIFLESKLFVKFDKNKYSKKTKIIKDKTLPKKGRKR